MYKILKLNKIATEGLSIFPIDDYETGTEIANPDAILLRSFDMHEMKLPASLLAVGRAGAGVNNIPIDKCAEKGIVVFNSPGANANAVKELVLAGLFLASRDVFLGLEYAQSIKGKGDEVPALIEKNKGNYAGIEISGKTLGVIGLGKIGVMVANAAEALGMKVIGFDPFISVESAWGLSRDVERAGGLDALLAKCDYLSLHTPLNDSTKGMFNDEKFKIMKKGVRILNFSRGGIVNNDALLKAIGNDTVSRYVTDFPDDELLGNNKIIAIPHLGASTDEAEINCSVIVSHQLKDFLEKGNIVNSVNYPDAKLDTNSPYRLLVMNKNVPKMVGQISTILADANVNIVEMLNKSKGDYAYNIIDMENELNEKTIKALYDIKGVVKVRFIKMK
ncbi:MAG: 3-phosphoglycerate dehydrogenase [Candidatus Margulisbacteria bacterium GWF2_35_9]|nr:MAG: 3-phosphoglycerate dehydrogenase [Candidatus Margulisbacteria bacterium GWF2_35_9]